MCQLKQQTRFSCQGNSPHRLSHCTRISNSILSLQLTFQSFSNQVTTNLSASISSIVRQETNFRTIRPRQKYEEKLPELPFHLNLDRIKDSLASTPLFFYFYHHIIRFCVFFCVSVQRKGRGEEQK